MQKILRGLIATASAAAATAAVTVTISAAAPAAAAGTAGVADSSTLTTPVVASGRVLDAVNAPVAGAQVGLFAWPSVADDQVDEDVADLLPIAKTQSAPDGTYALRVDPTVDWTGYSFRIGPMTVPTSQIGNYFRANVLAVAVGATGTTTRGFSISTLASTASSSGGNVAASALATAAPTDTADSASAPPPTATEVDPSVAPTDVQTPSDDGSPDYVEGGGAGAGAVTEQAVTLGGSSAVVEPAASAPQSAGSNMFCTEKMKHDYGRQHTVVGQTGAWTNRVSHSFVYTTGSSSKLGYAVSTSGGAGTYTAGQTTNKTSASTQYYPSQGAWTYALYRTDFDYRKYFVHCVYGGLIDYDEYEVRPAKFLGGTSIVHPGTMPSTNQCSHYAPGSGLLKASTKAITWTNGVQFTGANLGVSLSSETGYTKTAEVKFRVGLTAVNGRDLCGHGDYPVGTPYLIVAKT